MDIIPKLGLLSLSQLF